MITTSDGTWCCGMCGSAAMYHDDVEHVGKCIQCGTEYVALSVASREMRTVFDFEDFSYGKR